MKIHRLLAVLLLSSLSFAQIDTGAGGGGGGSTDLTAPGPIGGTTPSTGAFTTLAVAGPSPYIDVTAAGYAADVTGAADATSAIQAAITALGSRGGTVFIPNGTYKVDAGPIIITTPVKVVCGGRATWGSGTSTTVLQTTTGNHLIMQIGTMNSASVNQSGASIENCVFRDSTTNNLGGIGGLAILNTNHVQLDNDSFEGFRRPTIAMAGNLLAAPTASCVTVTSAPGGARFVQIRLVNIASGETVASTETSAGTCSAGQGVQVTAPTLTSPSVGYKVYIGATSGSEVAQLTSGRCTLDASNSGCTSNWTETSAGIATGRRTPAKYDTFSGFGLLVNSNAGADTTLTDASYIELHNLRMRQNAQGVISMGVFLTAIGGEYDNDLFEFNSPNAFLQLTNTALEPRGCSASLAAGAITESGTTATLTASATLAPCFTEGSTVHIYGVGPAGYVGNAYTINPGSLTSTGFTFTAAGALGTSTGTGTVQIDTTAVYINAGNSVLTSNKFETTTSVNGNTCVELDAGADRTELIGNVWSKCAQGSIAQSVLIDSGSQGNMVDMNGWIGGNVDVTDNSGGTTNVILRNTANSSTRANTFPLVNAAVGFQLAGAAPSGHTLVGNGTNYVDGTVGAGTVTSVGFTGGLLSVGTPTSTPAFTVAGTSGGIPYFASSSTWASSAALGAGQFVLGGGAGASPTSSFSIVPVANGGTGNAFFTVSGPASSAKTYTFPNANATMTQTIASGAKALATSAIGSAACSSAQTDTATGTITTDTIQATFNGDPTAVTGFVPLTTGMLTVIVYPTADTVNFKVCNNTSGSITPGAITLNWKVTR